VEHGGILDLEGAHGHFDGLDGEVVVVFGGGVAAHQLGPGGHLALGVLDVGAGDEDVPGDGVQGESGLVGQDALGLGEDGVDGEEVHLVGDGDIVAVLLDGGGDGGDGELFAVGGDAL